MIAPEVGGGFGSEAPGVRRGGARLLVLAQARAPGQVDRDADREHGRRPPGPRPDRDRADGRQARRHDHRVPRQDHRRLRRLQHAADAADPVARRVRDGRLLRDPERADRHRRRVHEQVPDRRDPRRRPARGDAHDRGHARSARGRARDGSGGDPAQELHPQGQLPGGGGDRASYTTPATTRRRSTGCSSTSTSTRSAPSRRRCARRVSTAGSGSRRTPRSAGSRRRGSPGQAGVGVQAGGWESAMVRVHNTGAVTAYTGTSGHGQGHETAFAQIVADRLGVDPEIVEVIHGDTGTGPGGPQHVRLALARRRRRGARPVREQDRRQGQGGRRPQPRGGARGHRAGRRQVLGQGLARQGDDARRGRRRRVPATWSPRGWTRGSRRRRSTTRRTSCSRSGRTRAWSTSTRRPARRRSCATSRSTTAATRSTR